uniref:Uncharacterized protein n=1 Tax=uncultured marine group II/III euryarchaeote SAT1000_06_A08 TaxID=1456553 RepID=A0A075I795_9EURY|nr:hypothetical protein [uncultured marine group II/III euryarchaeote SAT1000_06_A08]
MTIEGKGIAVSPRVTQFAASGSLRVVVIAYDFEFVRRIVSFSSVNQSEPEIPFRRVVEVMGFEFIRGDAFEKNLGIRVSLPYLHVHLFRPSQAVEQHNVTRVAYYEQCVLVAQVL